MNIEGDSVDEVSLEEQESGISMEDAEPNHGTTGDEEGDTTADALADAAINGVDSAATLASTGGSGVEGTAAFSVLTEAEHMDEASNCSKCTVVETPNRKLPQKPDGQFDEAPQKDEDQANNIELNVDAIQAFMDELCRKTNDRENLNPEGVLLSQSGAGHQEPHHLPQPDGAFHVFPGEFDDQPGAFHDTPGQPLLRQEQGRLVVVAQPQPPVLARQETSEGHVSLVVANPVGDSRQEDLPLALHVNNDGHTEGVAGEWRCEVAKQRRIACIVTSALMIGGILVLVVLLTTRGPVDQSRIVHSTQVPTVSPTLSLESYILSLFPDYTLAAIPESGSPQAKAYQWLVSDDALLSYPEWRILQRFALATFFYSTGGPEWFNATNWLSYSHNECEWFAAEADWDVPSPCAEDSGDAAEALRRGVYRRLSQPNNGLHGTLPLELSWLSSLENIILMNNNLEGTISTLIGTLSDLNSLSLGSNRISGTIPSELGLLANMTYLRVFSNELRSTIPTELGLLSNLEHLLLDSNFLTGPIPTELGELDQINWLYLFSNRLTGSFPTELGVLSLLNDLVIHANLLTSTVPTELSQLPKIIILSLANNMLTGGTIPTELGLLSTLEFLELQESQLEGPIPSELGILTSLVGLYLMRNVLTNSIPSELGAISTLQTLWLHGNQLSGTIPGELEPLLNRTNGTSLEYVTIGDNALLSGTVPAGLCSAGEFEFDCTSLLCGCGCMCHQH